MLRTGIMDRTSAVQQVNTFSKCRMRALLIRFWFLLTVSVLSITAGGVLAFYTRQTLWIAVAGSVVTFISGIAACRKFIRLGLSETLVSNIPIGGGAILPTQDDYELARQEDLDDRACLLAFALIAIGTPMQIVGYLMN